MIAGRYLIFARHTALKNVVGANRPVGESTMHGAKRRPTMGETSYYP